jgi:hypothetical protein
MENCQGDKAMRKKFSPFRCAADFGAFQFMVSRNHGWVMVSFETKETAMMFESECRKNNHSTQNMSRNPDGTISLMYYEKEGKR